MSYPQNILSAYTHYRRRGMSPSAAMHSGMRDIEQGKRHYAKGFYPTTPSSGRMNKDGLRWIENLTGWRDTGAAHDIVRMRHTGWYVDNDQCELIMGHVWQLPTKNGKERFLAGYKDIYGNEGARIDCRTVYDCKEDAALGADEIARIAAEHEREYREESDAAQRYVDLRHDIANQRKTLIQIIRDAKAFAHGKVPESLCGVLRCTVRRMLANIRRMQEDAAELKRDYGRSQGWKDCVGD